MKGRALFTSEPQTGSQAVVDLDEDSGLGMEETIQARDSDSPFLCSSFGGLLNLKDEATPNTSLSELQGSLPKLTDLKSTAKRSLFHQKRVLDSETPKLPSKRQRRQNKGKTFKKSFSFDVATERDTDLDVVNKLLDADDLVADGSRSYRLPTVSGKHRDLKSVSPQTVADLVSGKYEDSVQSYKVIDCRYPFEYEGGHIKGAVNLYTQDSIVDLLMDEAATSKPEVLIFHCEFSSERGPKMCRLLRSKDREVNAACYPYLTFPEVYIMEGGYKAFYNLSERQPLCEPMDYKPMHHKDHVADVRHFRAKSKSWTHGEKKNLNRILF